MSEKELYEKAAKAGFSKQEVDALKNFSKIMASQVMKKFLTESVREAGAIQGVSDFTRGKDVPADKKEIYAVYKRLMASILRIKSESFTGYQELEFEDGAETYKLRMQLSLVPKNFEFEIRIPNGYERAFFSHLDKLIQIAMQYYHVEAGNIIKDLALMFPNDNVSSLGINPRNRTLCLSETGNVRIGVLCFYVDAEGKPLQ